MIYPYLEGAEFICALGLPESLIFFVRGGGGGGGADISPRGSPLVSVEMSGAYLSGFGLGKRLLTFTPIALSNSVALTSLLLFRGVVTGIATLPCKVVVVRPVHWTLSPRSWSQLRSGLRS